MTEASDPTGLETAAQDGVVAALPGGGTRISCSRGLDDWLIANRTSLAFTSYQTGQLFLVGVLPDGRLSFHQQDFVRAMGLHGQSERLYVAALNQLWRLENVLEPHERANAHFDRLYMPRNAQVTGDLDIHELAVDRAGRVIFVNTKFSCLATTSVSRSFRALWKPPFVSKIAAEDRCHLNGLAMQDGTPRFVTCVGRSDVVDGWRSHRRDGGLLMEIEDGRVLAEGFSMPHSPRVSRDGALFVLDSGRGWLERVDPRTGARDRICFLSGFARGLALWNNFALVTLSRPRDDSFEGLELQESLAARGGEAWCGVQVIDLRSGDAVHWIRLEGHIKELFDIAVLPGVHCPMAVGIGAPEMSTMLSFEQDFAALAPADGAGRV
jgi:uncharacterized protein (TIGR03032 family)